MNQTSYPSRAAFAMLGLAAGLAIATPSFASEHRWTGGDNFTQNFSSPLNWENGSVPGTNETNVRLVFPPFVNGTSPIQNIVGLKVDQIDIQGGGYTFYGTAGSKLTLRGTTDAVFASVGALFHSSLEVEVENQAEFDVAFNYSITIQGRISGAGGIRKTGLGGLEFMGASANTYAGETWVHAGTLRLNKNAGITAVPGDLEVGDGSGGNDVDIVRLMQDNQISNTAAVTINPAGLLNLNNNDDTFGTITMQGGHISSGTGVLFMNGHVTTLASAEVSQIDGRIDLGGRGKIFTIADGGAAQDLVLAAQISGGNLVGFAKNGPGAMSLGGSNTFSGPVSHNDGTLIALNNWSFGSTNSGTMVASGASLVLGQVLIPTEPLTLNGVGVLGAGALIANDGSAIWDGIINLATDSVISSTTSVDFYLRGRMEGNGGFTKIGDGNLLLTGDQSNTYLGDTAVLGGTLTLSKVANIMSVPGRLIVGHDTQPAPFPRDVVKVTSSHQIANDAPIEIHLSGSLEFESASDGIASLDFTGGRMVVNGGTVTMLGNIHCSAPANGMAFISGSGVFSMGAQSRIIDVDPHCGLAITAVISGASGIGFLKQGEGILELRAANTYSGITYVEAGQVFVTGPDGNLGTSSQGTIVAQGAQLAISWVQLGEDLVLNGDAANGRPSFSAHGDCTWAGDIALGGATNTIEVQTVRLIASGVISGGGTLRLLGHKVNNAPTLAWLSGTLANTYSGPTVCESVELWMSKLPGQNAVPGPLFLLAPADATQSPCRAFLKLGNQIADSAPITLLDGAVFDAGDANETVGPVYLDHATVKSTNGVVTLNGNVTVTATPASYIRGNLSLGSANRTFDVAGNYGGALEFYLTAKVSGLNGSAGIVKTGSGEMDMSGSNSYSGVTLVQQGIVRVSHSSALGTGVNGTLVSDGAVLQLANNVTVAQEGLTLNGLGDGGEFYNAALIGLSGGPTTWTGPIGVASPTAIRVENVNSPLTLSGVISGSSMLWKRGVGTLEFAGAANNTHSADVIVEQGELALNKTGALAVAGGLIIGDTNSAANSDVVRLLQPNQIGDTVPVAVLNSGLLNLNNFSDAIGSLVGSGTVNTLFATLTVGGANTDTTFSGLIGGVGFVTLNKTGTGTLTLTGNNTYSGKTIIDNGTLVIDGLQASSAVEVNPLGTLAGTGSAGNVSAFIGSDIVPGHSPGILRTKNFTLDDNVVVHIEIEGNQPGTGYDQIDVAGSVGVTLAQLQVTNAPSFKSAVGDQFVIIKNDGNDAVSGTFLGLPQNSTFLLNGALFRISYNGGDGNDVVLTHVNTPPSIAGLNITSNSAEGGVVNFSGQIVDPDLVDGFFLMVNWGDGSPAQQIQFAPGTLSFNVSHAYVDDNPTTTPSDTYLIDYTLHDSSGPGAFGNYIVTIANAVPVVNAGADVKVAKDIVFNVNGSFTDAGVNDTWQATVDYGDGSGVQPLTLNPDKTFVLSHAYTNNGAFTVTVRVNDDDSGQGVDTLLVNVTEPAAAPVLKIVPGPGNGRVTVSWPSAAVGFELESTTDLNSGVWTKIPFTPVDEAVENVVVVPKSGPMMFFRLVKQ
ncbi:MAG: autotransporter-associated beta strand repeat-containing protein [Verrucomicrobia bacterium]|nr:autotransporter-associated beta strand repeat-containing protein [Verrucomicrobiota bacterium]